MNRIILVVIITIMLIPMWFLCTGSLQNVRGVLVMPPRLFPVKPTLQNYKWVFEKPWQGWAVNTVIVTIATIAVSVLTTVAGAYAITIMKWRYKNILWAALLAGVMIPRMSMLIPLFVVMRKLELSGTLLSVILPSAYMPTMLYLAKTFFDTVPKSVLESARIDGAGEWRVMWAIVAPLSRPIIATIALFSGINAMGDYLWQLLQLQREEKMTLLIGLMRAAMQRGGGGAANINPLGYSLATAVVLALPLFLIFIGANRYFVNALGGAVKE